MNRREFITLVGGVAIAWPPVSQAQQPERQRRIGVLMNFAADDPEGTARIAAFVEGLRQSDWIDGQNLHIDYRWPAQDLDRLRSSAEELLALQPDIILASGTPWRHFCTQPALCRSSLQRSSTRSAAASSAAWRVRRQRHRDFIVRIWLKREMVGAP
jgi:hypothetical protein